MQTGQRIRLIIAIVVIVITKPTAYKGLACYKELDYKSARMY
jgi:hypothetical protein